MSCLTYQPTNRLIRVGARDAEELTHLKVKEVSRLLVDLHLEGKDRPWAVLVTDLISIHTFLFHVVALGYSYGEKETCS